MINVGRFPAQTVIYGKKFLMGTMWTDLSNPMHKWIAKGGMNDYKLIKYSRDRHWFTPEDTTREFVTFRETLKDCKPDIVVSHHLPSYGSIDPIYKNDDRNCAYATEMDVSGVKLWIHGHTHHGCDYVKQGCRIVCNPKGYPSENDDWIFKVVEV